MMINSIKNNFLPQKHNSLKKIQDGLIVDVEKIISTYNLPEKNDDD